MLAGMTEVVTAVLEGRTHHALMPLVANPEALLSGGPAPTPVRPRGVSAGSAGLAADGLDGAG